MSKLIAIIDYRAGNIKSVENALKICGAKPIIATKPLHLKKSAGIILPGVGAFKDGMKNLEKRKLIKEIKSQIFKGKPFLGICLGFQLLFSYSEEHGRVKGLDILKGGVKKFKVNPVRTGISNGVNLKIPHMGWNTVKLKIKNEKLKMPMFDGISDNAFFYFVHSYYAKPSEKNVVAGMTNYGINFCSAISKQNIWGVQFHPEKSGKNGLKILRNFIKKCL